MRALLASPLGFLIGLSLGALGGGGSILAVPALVYGAGQDARSATTTSLALVGTTSLIGMVAHWRAGRVRVGTGIAFGLAGVGGSIAGTALNHHVDADLRLLGFAGLVFVAAWRMVIGCPTCTKVGEATVMVGAAGDAAPRAGGPAPRVLDLSTIVAVLLAGTAVGFLTGLFGVGGGFVIVPALTLVLRLPMPEAIGTSLLVIAVNSASALVSRIPSADLDMAVTVPFAIAAIAGVLTGGHVADRLAARRSLRWFAGLLVAVALYTATRAIMSLT